MPFQASSLAMVQSTRMRSTSPACTYGRVSPTACAAKIFWVKVIGWRAEGLMRSTLPRRLAAGDRENLGSD